MYLFIFLLLWVFVTACPLYLAVVRGATLYLPCVGFSLQWLFMSWSTGSRCSGFIAVASGSRAQAQQLWRPGLDPPRHVGSFWIRAGTCVSCFGRQILYH